MAKEIIEKKEDIKEAVLTILEEVWSEQERQMRLSHGK